MLITTVWISDDGGMICGEMPCAKHGGNDDETIYAKHDESDDEKNVCEMPDASDGETIYATHDGNDDGMIYVMNGDEIYVTISWMNDDDGLHQTFCGTIYGKIYGTIYGKIYGKSCETYGWCDAFRPFQKEQPSYHDFLRMPYVQGQPCALTQCVQHRCR